MRDGQEEIGDSLAGFHRERAVAEPQVLARSTRQRRETDVLEALVIGLALGLFLSIVCGDWSGDRRDRRSGTALRSDCPASSPVVTFLIGWIVGDWWFGD